jgi:hypothetical protein
MMAPNGNTTSLPGARVLSQHRGCSGSIHESDLPRFCADDDNAGVTQQAGQPASLASIIADVWPTMSYGLDICHFGGERCACSPWYLPGEKGSASPR